jgi:hypothetical protein
VLLRIGERAKDLRIPSKKIEEKNILSSCVDISRKVTLITILADDFHPLHTKEKLE